jgi:hypothetical protein
MRFYCASCSPHEEIGMRSTPWRDLAVERPCCGETLLWSEQVVERFCKKEMRQMPYIYDLLRRS